MGKGGTDRCQRALEVSWATDIGILQPTTAAPTINTAIALPD
jgi:hypothetical protein